MKKYLRKFLFFCMLPLAVHGAGVKLDRMTMNVGGKAALPMSFNRHGESSFAADIAPRYGIFVIDNLEVALEFNTQFNFIVSKQPRLASTPIKWGLSSEALYYFATPSIVTPYIGAGLGFRIMNWNLLSINLSWSVPMGVLIAVQENLAIDLGLGVKGFMSFRSLGERLEVNPAFLGLRYLF